METNTMRKLLASLAWGCADLNDIIKVRIINSNNKTFKDVLIDRYTGEGHIVITEAAINKAEVKRL